MESERLPQGADPKLHTKLGPGGLSDVEWLIQLIQMQHAQQVPKLQITQTRLALDIAVEAGLLPVDQGEVLHQTWSDVSSLRNAMILSSGRAGDLLPTDVQVLAAISMLTGLGSQGGQEVLEHYQRMTRRTRRIFVEDFYGTEGA
jgi:glutamate-ammonia-ligase adenylyltransferase